jgi:tetratricopeptide (TPR) repeat protein
MASLSMTAQTKTELLKHFEAYYKQMKSQGDVQGVINAMTHLNVLEPSKQRLDTLAYIYVSEGRNLEALNTIGIDNNPTDSDISTEVKALALKALNQPKRALVFYEELFKKQPNSYLAYEIADLKVQTQDLAGAKAGVDYGLANVKDDMKKAFYETQQPYEVSLKGALTYLKALIVFNMNQVDNLDQAIGLLDEAITMDSNFNLAKLSKDALVAKKAPKKE